MSSTILDQHIKHLKAGPANIFLGRLLWYSIRGSEDDWVSHGDVVALLKQAGLEGEPAFPRNHDVFRRVCTSNERNKTATGTPGVFVRYKLIEVSKRSDRIIVKRIVRELIDSDDQELTFSQLMDISFNRDHSDWIKTSICDDYLEDPEVASTIARQVKQQYKAQRDLITAYTVREFVRSLLMKKGATCVRPAGGLYFLKESLADHADAVEAFVNSLPDNLGHGHSLPLVDDGKQRAMLRRAFEAETVGAVDELMVEIRDIRQSGKMIRPDRYQRMFLDYRSLHSKTKDYGELLDTQLASTQSRLQLLEAAIVGLSANVKD